jgi:ankyrin repeat protein
VDIKNADGTPLHVVAAANEVKAIKILLDAGCIINAGDNESETVLMFATRNEHTEAASLLLDRGPDINARTIWGLTAFDLCVRYSKYIATLTPA